MKKTAILIALIFVTGTGGTFFLLKPHPKKQLEKALLQMKQKNYSGAECFLKSLTSSHGHLLPQLYLAYLEQARGRYDLSENYLQTALQEANKKNDLNLITEILVAQATNAFVQQHDLELCSYVSTARRLSPNHVTLPFFNGLERYINQDYAEALQLWNTFSFESSEEWIACSLENFFPQAWRKLHSAHCLIELGNYLAAREILEVESRRDGENSFYLSHLTTLFLGLSYLKEGSQVHSEKRDSYYKLALFYFERSGIRNQLDPWIRERNRAATLIEQEADRLFLAEGDSFKEKWYFDFIQCLHEWKADASIVRLSEKLGERILQQKGESEARLCAAIRADFLGTPLHTHITEKILHTLSTALKEGETDNLIALWNLVESISPHPKVDAKEIASIAAEEILETIKKDNVHLSRTRRFIAFWEALGRSSHEREILARNLLIHAKLFWHNEKQEKKGQRLMEIALNLSEKSPFIEKEISIFLTKLYVQAEQSNMIRRLSLIYDAMELFGISRKELLSKTTLANHLADAEYQYEAHNYPIAKTHACWVLKLDPHNERARRLAGLCAFNLREYKKALAHLKLLKHPDEDACKMLVLSKAFASQEQEGHLCQIDASDSFDEND